MQHKDAIMMLLGVHLASAGDGPATDAQMNEAVSAVGKYARSVFSDRDLGAIVCMNMFTVEASHADAGKAMKDMIKRGMEHAVKPDGSEDESSRGN